LKEQHSTMATINPQTGVYAAALLSCLLSSMVGNKLSVVPRVQGVPGR
jgi:hypothetical protein